LPVSPLLTERLVLRGWLADDRPAFAALNADPEVMKHFPACLDRAESDALIDRIESHFEQHGYGLFAVERKGDPGLVGFVGLNRVDFEAHFTPAVEIGWRLARESWGEGIASEAAAACLRFAFTELALPQVVSFTTPANERSQAVMQRIGMTRNPLDDFDHPKLAAGHAMRRHVLYRSRA
jgi:RimJ/RimL family protein N-acetyltransferase